MSEAFCGIREELNNTESSAVHRYDEEDAASGWQDETEGTDRRCCGDQEDPYEAMVSVRSREKAVADNIKANETFEGEKRITFNEKFTTKKEEISANEMELINEKIASSTDIDNGKWTESDDIKQDARRSRSGEEEKKSLKDDHSLCSDKTRGRPKIHVPGSEQNDTESTEGRPKIHVPGSEQNDTDSTEGK